MYERWMDKNLTLAATLTGIVFDDRSPGSRPEFNRTTGNHG
jgi:hypothetical protein